MNQTIGLDADLAKVVSYLTFDGHLAEDLKCFYLSSKNRESLFYFGGIIYKKFGILGRLEKGTGYGESYKYRVFSRDICRFLESMGVPKGNKTRKCFSIPDWIKYDGVLSRQYLTVAFDCEGSVWRDTITRIRFGICKSLRFLDDGISFVNGIKEMMLRLDVETTNSWLTKTKENPCGVSTKGIYFNIRQRSIKKFAERIGFSDRFKNQRLSELIGT